VKLFDLRSKGITDPAQRSEMVRPNHVANIFSETANHARSRLISARLKAVLSTLHLQQRGNLLKRCGNREFVERLFRFHVLEQDTRILSRFRFGRGEARH
jgi:hypothetical protein